MWKKFIANKLLLIIILAAFLRLFLLNRVPASLNWDEISMGYTANVVAQTGMDEWGEKMPIFFRSYGEWKSAVYIYLLVPLVKFFGMNAWTVRLPSALAGILAVYVTYLIGKKLYSDRTGLWAALFLAISPWHLVLSRPAFEANVSLTLILAGVHFFLSWQEKSALSARSESNGYFPLILSAIAFGLAPHTYNSAKVVVPFLVIYMVWKSKLFKNLKHLAVLLGILAIFAAPIALNLISGRAQHRYTQVGVSTDTYALDQFVQYRTNPVVPKLVGRLVFNRYTLAGYSFARNWLSYLSPAHLLIEAGDHNQHHVKYFGILYVAEFILVIYGFRVLSGQKSPLKYLPLTIIALGIVPAALTRENGHVLRSILTLPGWQLLAGLGMVEFSKMKTPYVKIVNWLLVIQVATFMVAYFMWYPSTFARDWQYGYREVAAYLREHEAEYDHIVTTKWYGESQLFYAFYNNWDPYWYIENNKPNLTYEEQGKLWLDQLDSYSVGKYEFKYIDWPNEKPTGKTLYIGKGDDFISAPADIKKIITFPDGTPAFVLATKL